MASDQPPARLYFFTYPRTGSNLLTHLLALDDQPNVQRQNPPEPYGMRFFLPLVLLKSKSRHLGTHVQALPQDQREEQERCVKECYGRLLDHIRNAEREGKMVCFKDHAHYIVEPVAEARLLYGDDSVTDQIPWTLRGPNELDQTDTDRSDLNDTLFSDDFLKTWKPAFLIRHPAAAFPSYYRALSKVSGPEFVQSDQGWKAYQKAMSLRWVYKLYNFYVQHFSKCRDDQASWPVVIEADDIINQPEILIKLCEITGLDSSRIRLTWEKSTSELPGVQVFHGTLLESTKIDTSKAVGDVDLEKESAKWQGEFGEHIGRRIEAYVREAMPDYLFLKSKRLRV
ncbi:hypothetical protein P170DRAFT_472232 [Aspergillus steynii IBT 23096]|uniref:P-loop containing nucleoside triphosphate hydrolase protein n=1 Tax=Aspergillus steynii IBT 23096 TaxID=1392250 RepID=A0A2I2GHH9_9EURO|nr:uncharacterized protein P170DRAFT_472232 [Aspergillus steynii IBT 23096]PLB52329.1 hypothetical protein P170DRAFT_472232 [Aspergillus steynii IBT 23096]